MAQVGHTVQNMPPQQAVELSIIRCALLCCTLSVMQRPGDWLCRCSYSALPSCCPCESIDNRFRRRAVVIDVGGEVAGAGPVPHACIGKARRVPVRERAGQAAAILEAVQNHAPQVRRNTWLCPPPLSSLALRSAGAAHKAEHLFGSNHVARRDQLPINDRHAVKICGHTSRVTICSATTMCFRTGDRRRRHRLCGSRRGHQGCRAARRRRRGVLPGPGPAAAAGEPGDGFASRRHAARGRRGMAEVRCMSIARAGVTPRGQPVYYPASESAMPSYAHIQHEGDRVASPFDVRHDSMRQNCCASSQGWRETPAKAALGASWASGVRRGGGGGCAGQVAGPRRRRGFRGRRAGGLKGACTGTPSAACGTRTYGCCMTPRKTLSFEFDGRSSCCAAGGKATSHSYNSNIQNGAWVLPCGDGRDSVERNALMSSDCLLCCRLGAWMRRVASSAACRPEHPRLWPVNLLGRQHSLCLRRVSLG